MNIDGNIASLPVRDDLSEDEVKTLQKKLESSLKEETDGELDIPDDTHLVLRDHDGNIVGGVITSAKIRVMFLEVLWVDDAYRDLGYGRDLVLEAERIGSEKGYISSQVWTFDFQAPEFYQSIGYEVIWVYDGYTDGITEIVLKKRLSPGNQEINDKTEMGDDESPDRFTISEYKTEESEKILRVGLNKYGEEHVGELRKKNPEIPIKLGIRDDDGIIVGGILAGTTLKTMCITGLWIDEDYRRHGYGSKLVHKAEEMAKEKGCISGQTWVLSFQAPRFFERLGYTSFGISDGFPKGITEHYFIKRF